VTTSVATACAPAAARGPVDELLADPRRFTLLQAVRVLASAGVGVRYRPSLHLAFPAAEIETVRDLPGSGTRTCEITTPLLGVYGPCSPLPAYITEFLLHHDDGGRARAFIDRFNHRILALFAQACAKYRPVADGGSTAAYRRRLLELLAAPRDAGVDLLPYAGALLRQPSAAALEAILRDRFAPLEVAVEQCVARWTGLPRSEGALLGSSRLGVDSVAGDAVWSRATSFRITIGPVAGTAIRRFAPDGDGAREIAEITARCDPDGLEWDLELVVDGADLAPTALGADVRLGWSTRLDGAAPDTYRIVCSGPLDRPGAERPGRGCSGADP
jgi:type VI secretion system protein ImpH